MKQLFLLVIVMHLVGCASVPNPSSLVGCYRVEISPPRPWLKFNGRAVEINPSTSVRLYADTHPHFIEGSGFFRSVPLIGSPPDAEEYLWRVLDGNLRLRLGGDSGGISVSVKIDSKADTYKGTAVPFIDMGPTEYQTSQAIVVRVECPGMGANNSFNPMPLRGTG